MNLNDLPAGAAADMDTIAQACEQACSAIAPAWPLDRAIAVNPHWQRVGRPLREVAARMAVLGNMRVFPARPYVLQAWNEGRVTAQDLEFALRELEVSTWFAGIRRNQAESRKEIPYLEWAGGRWKVHPIAEWTDRDVHRYLTKHNLPYHPLWEKGYVSIGDHHSTKPLHEVATLEETRFNGLKRECGIHEINLADL